MTGTKTANTARRHEWEHARIQRSMALRCKSCGLIWLPDENAPKGACSGSSGAAS